MKVYELNQETIRMIADELEQGIQDLAVWLGLKAWTFLVVNTPVGNPSLWTSNPPKNYAGGQARHSWNISLDKPDETLPATWSTGIPPTPQFTGAGFSPVYVTSPLVYMPRLNDGWSSQGSHMVERAVNVVNFELKTLNR
jgi:hypothetical protein